MAARASVRPAKRARCAAVATGSPRPAFRDRSPNLRPQPRIDTLAVGAKARNMDASGGSASYAGYEYQLLVTVWAALELMVVKPVASELQIEARSHEDIEADLRVPRDDALVSVAAATNTVRLVVQVKSRSTGPWSVAAFKALLLGRQHKPAKKGPAPRAQRSCSRRSGPHTAVGRRP